MREMSFSQLWPKLAQPRLTTFRFARRDEDWAVGETVTVLFKARSHNDRSVLGQAVILGKVPRWVSHVTVTNGIARITAREAMADGFEDIGSMYDFMDKTPGHRRWEEPMNKLTLAWTQYWLYQPEQKPHVQKAWAKLLGTERAPSLSISGKGPQFIVHQDLLYDIHQQAALGALVALEKEVANESC